MCFNETMALKNKEELEAICNHFVANYQGFAQRSEEWHRTINITVGGSEVAKLMGASAESKAYTLAKEKLAALMGAPRWAGVPACWWGSLFEDALALVVGDDLGGKVVGDNICIQAVPGHRNSPDGYIVAAVENGAKILRARDIRQLALNFSGGPALNFSGGPALNFSGGPALNYEILLLEFKCPISRYPIDNEVPSQYIPQLLSGLAVSPDARRGLFVDAVFCKCALADFNDFNGAVEVNGAVQEHSKRSMKHDTDYHKCFHDCLHICRSDTPYAWGIVKLYTPHGTTNSLHNGVEGTTIIDLGSATTLTFNKALQDISEKRLIAVHCTPNIAGNIDDGSSMPVDYAGELASELAGSPAGSPAGSLVAIIPWKLAPPVYCIVNRQEGFLESLQPLIGKIHKSVGEALASPNPSEYLLSCFDVKPKKKSKIAVDHAEESVQNAQFTKMYAS